MLSVSLQGAAPTTPALPSPRAGSPRNPDQRSAPALTQPTSSQQTRISDQSRSIVTRNETGVDLSGLGEQIFSTGLEDIWVRILPKDPTTNITYVSRIYVLSPGKGRYLGSNYERKFINLGRLAAGELLIGASNTVERTMNHTGPGSRNPDRLAHATVRQLSDGVVDVRFEDSGGLPEQRLVDGSWSQRKWAHDNFFQDTVLQFSGGVTTDPTVLTLLPMLRDSDPEKRRSAETILKQGYPKIARSAGLR